MTADGPQERSGRVQPRWTNDNPKGYFYAEESHPWPDPGPATGDEGRGWRVVFTDVMSLLLAFFVLVFSMQGIEFNQWRIAVDSLTRTLQPWPDGPSLPTARRRVDRSPDVPGADLDYLRAVLTETMGGLPDLAGQEIRRVGRRLIVSLPAPRLFDERGEMTAEGRDRVAAIGSLLRHLDNAVGVIGVIGRDAGGARVRERRWSELLQRADAIAGGLRQGGYRRPLEVLARWTGASGDRVEIAVMSTEASR